MTVDRSVDVQVIRTSRHAGGENKLERNLELQDKNGLDLGGTVVELQAVEFSRTIIPKKKKKKKKNY